MAGEWIKVETCTPGKPEILRMAEALNVSRDLVFGKLIRLWIWFDQHTKDGNAKSVTASLIDSVLDHPGFCEAAQKVGWIEPTDSGIRLPNFNRHNGKTAKKRALTARRVAAFKKRNGNDYSVTRALPREEKRREEITPIPPSGAFLKFWGSWPKGERKKAQGKCWELWRRRDFDQAADAILAHVDALKRSEGWRSGFVPMPITYLNQRQWEGAEMAEDSAPRVAMP